MFIEGLFKRSECFSGPGHFSDRSSFSDLYSTPVPCPFCVQGHFSALFRSFVLHHFSDLYPFFDLRRIVFQAHARDGQYVFSQFQSAYHSFSCFPILTERQHIVSEPARCFS
jgi:hypothetical protein